MRTRKSRTEVMPAWTYWRVIKELKESTLESESGFKRGWESCMMGKENEDKQGYSHRWRAAYRTEVIQGKGGV